MQYTLYHIVLRTSALTLSLVLLFVSGVISPVTQQMSRDTKLYLATAVGMYAAVEPNGLNEITAVLTAREAELDQREATIAERELNLGFNVEDSTADYTTYILSVMVFILLVLIVLNYVMDYMRSTQTAKRSNYGTPA